MERHTHLSSVGQMGVFFPWMHMQILFDSFCFAFGQHRCLQAVRNAGMAQRAVQQHSVSMLSSGKRQWHPLQGHVCSRHCVESPAFLCSAFLFGIASGQATVPHTKCTCSQSRGFAFYFKQTSLILR